MYAKLGVYSDLQAVMTVRLPKEDNQAVFLHYEGHTW